MQTPGPPGRWGAGGSDADVYLMSWARIWFTLGNQTVYRRPHLSLPPLLFHFSVMFCRSASGPCGKVSGVTRITPVPGRPAWDSAVPGLAGCAGAWWGLRGGGRRGPRGRQWGRGPLIPPLAAGPGDHQTPEPSGSRGRGWARGSVMVAGCEKPRAQGPRARPGLTAGPWGQGGRREAGARGQGGRAGQGRAAPGVHAALSPLLPLWAQPGPPGPQATVPPALGSGPTTHRDTRPLPRWALSPLGPQALAGLRWALRTQAWPSPPGTLPDSAAPDPPPSVTRPGPAPGAPGRRLQGPCPSSPRDSRVAPHGPGLASPASSRPPGPLCLSRLGWRARSAGPERLGLPWPRSPLCSC